MTKRVYSTSIEWDGSNWVGIVKERETGRIVWHVQYMPNAIIDVEKERKRLLYEYKKYGR